MANAIVTFKLMPVSPEVDFDAIGKKADEILKKYKANGQTLIQINPLAFGLKEVIAKGMFEVSDDLNADTIAEEMKKIEGVSEVDNLGMDLAMG